MYRISLCSVWAVQHVCTQLEEQDWLGSVSEVSVWKSACKVPARAVGGGFCTDEQRTHVVMLQDFHGPADRKSVV